MSNEVWILVVGVLSFAVGWVIATRYVLGRVADTLFGGKRPKDLPAGGSVRCYTPRHVRLPESTAGCVCMHHGDLRGIGGPGARGYLRGLALNHIGFGPFFRRPGFFCFFNPFAAHGQIFQHLG